MIAQIIEIQPFHSGWQVRGVKAAASLSFFTGPSAIEHAIEYARGGTRHPSEIRLLGRNGEIITALPIEESRISGPPEIATLPQVRP
jgi:hypothetical protein